MLRVVPLVLTLVASVARAQPVSQAETIPDTLDLGKSGYRFDGVAPETSTSRTFALEMSFRGRMVSVPNSVLDAWYFDEDAQDWAYVEGRPRVRGVALGVEMVVKNESSNGIFYAEFIDSGMKAGYWDDVEEPADHLDGDFLRPSPGVGLLNLGANYAYEAHFVRTADTGGRFGLSLLTGGGLGVGLLTGVIDRWGPDDDGNPAYKRYLDGEAPDEDTRLPRVFPMVDINAGLRFTFGDRLVVRVEGGLHTMLYYGFTSGIMF